MPLWSTSSAQHFSFACACLSVCRFTFGPTPCLSLCACRSLCSASQTGLLRLLSKVVLGNARRQSCELNCRTGLLETMALEPSLTPTACKYGARLQVLGHRSVQVLFTTSVATPRCGDSGGSSLLVLCTIIPLCGVHSGCRLILDSRVIPRCWCVASKTACLV